MRRFRETVYQVVFTILAFASLVFLVGIILTLFIQALPVLREHRLLALLLGSAWYPTADPAEFGMLPLITASFVVTLGAMAVCIPVGIGTALYLHELAGESQRAFLKPMIE
ncbi:phosphate ABC transporter permease subunit PstC, partial [bacterium]|nr:phosphate ABC transporter permease subunit PstC [bacterium]